MLPFALFMALLTLRGQWQPAWAPGFDARWLYAAQALLPALLLLWCWREYGEFDRQNRPTAAEAALAVAVGAVVFGLWIHLDAPWMQLGTPTASFLPVDAGGALIWLLVALRLIGAALLVPVMEELFWRSFLMRWIDQPQFQAVEPARVGLKAIVLSTFIFMLAHTLWLAAILAGLAYAFIYRHSDKLWCAVIAHAVTNGVLGIWVVYTGRWQFW